MKKIEAYKNNSGLLFNTEIEAKEEDCKYKLVQFMQKDDHKEWYFS